MQVHSRCVALFLMKQTCGKLSDVSDQRTVESASRPSPNENMVLDSRPRLVSNPAMLHDTSDLCSPERFHWIPIPAGTGFTTLFLTLCLFELSTDHNNTDSR